MYVAMGRHVGSLYQRQRPVRPSLRSQQLRHLLQGQPCSPPTGRGCSRIFPIQTQPCLLRSSSAFHRRTTTGLLAETLCHAPTSDRGAPCSPAAQGVFLARGGAPLPALRLVRADIDSPCRPERGEDSTQLRHVNQPFLPY